MGNNTQENEPQSSRNSLVDLAKAIVAIAAVPLGAYTIINNFLEQPGITLGIAILTAIAASIYMVSSQRTNIRDLIIAWLTLIVITLAVFVIWPNTVTVQGTITDTANNAVPNEEVRLIDANGVLRAANTDNAGNYEFKDVPNGTFTIIVRENRIEGLAQVGAKQVSLLNITVPQPSFTPTPLVNAVVETAVPPASTNTFPPATESATSIASQAQVITLRDYKSQDVDDGQELYFDIREGETGKDLIGYILEITLDGADGRDAQLFFKNCNFDSVYSLPKPISNGVPIQFNPVSDPRRIDEFSSFSCIAAVGVKIFNNAQGITIANAQLINK